MEKHELLAIIEPMFYDKTFKEISLDMIWKKLDMKKASLYYYFPSKEKLLEELIIFSKEIYKENIINLTKKSPKDFVKEFIAFPKKNKNLFSIINQSWYCDNEQMKEILKSWQKEILSIINLYFKEKLDFSDEKVFILLSIMEDISKKRCIYWECPMDIEKITNEIYLIFNIK